MLVIMGMTFKADEAPDFGSIRLTAPEQCHIKSYILNSEDVPKLELITNAGEGSVAFCVDTNELYIKHLGRWSEIK